MFLFILLLMKTAQQMVLLTLFDLISSTLHCCYLHTTIEISLTSSFRVKMFWMLWMMDLLFTVIWITYLTQKLANLTHLFESMSCIGYNWVAYIFFVTHNYAKLRVFRSAKNLKTKDMVAGRDRGRPRGIEADVLLLTIFDLISSTMHWCCYHTTKEIPLTNSNSFWMKMLWMLDDLLNVYGKSNQMFNTNDIHEICWFNSFISQHVLHRL